MDGKALKLSFGRRLKFLRELRQMTQSALAEEVGVTEQYLSMMERGLSSPSFGVISKLCHVLTISPASLFLPPKEVEQDKGGAEVQDGASSRNRPLLDWSRSLARMGVLELDLIRDREHWSESLQTILGRRAEAGAMDWDGLLRLVAPQDRARLKDARESLESGLNVDLFLFGFRRDKDLMGHAVLQGEVEFDSDGAPSRAWMFILDVSERQRIVEMLLDGQDELEEQLRERTLKLARTVRRLEQEVADRKAAEDSILQQKKALRALLDASRDLAYLADTKGNMLAVNATAARAWGGEPKDFVGRNRFEMLPPDVAEFRRRKFQQVHRAKAPLCYSDQRDGRHFDTCINPILEDDGQVIGYAVFGRDVTEYHEAGERLRQSEGTLRALLAAAPVGFTLLDKERRLSMVNQRLADMLGYTVEDLEHGPARQVFDDEAEYSRCKELLKSGLDREDVIFLEMRLARRDGSFIDAYASAALLDREAGDDDVIITVLDVTELKRLEALRDDMERVIRHDLRAPVQSALGLCRMLQADQTLGERQRFLVSQLEASSQRMLQLLNLSLDLHRMESGKYPLRPSAVDLAVLCRKAVQELAARDEHGASRVRVFLNGEPCSDTDSFTALADERLFLSLLINLLANAVEAEGNGPVTVSLDRADHTVISVHNGSVVPEQVRATFFDKHSTWGKENGKGLGTYAVRLIAGLHGGEVAMRTDPAEGTTVSVRLPAEAAVKASAPA